MGVRTAITVIVVAAACKPSAPAAPAKRQLPEARAEAGSAVAPAPAPIPTPEVEPAPDVPAGMPVTRMTLAEVGLEATSLDRSVDPCVDFYQFACGGWLQSHKIPDDRSSWSRFAELGEKNQNALRGLLEENAKGIGADAGAKKLGDFYASCMDEAAIEQAGTKPLAALLGKTTKVKDAKSWLAAVTALHAAGIWVVWDASAEPDMKDSTTYVTQLDSAGLGLPDRDYYVDAKFAEQVTAYGKHVGRMLALAGIAKPEAAAADVVAIETALAKLTKTGVERRDPKAAYNPLDAKALAKQTRSVDWKAYWKALGITPSKKVVVGSPKFFAGLDGLRKQFKPAQWASYFTYHLFVRNTLALPKAYDDEAFELRKSLTGVATQEPRYRRCVVATTNGLGELLGRQYVEKYFPASARQTASMLVDEVVKVMTKELGTLEWMSEPTRQTAQGKLAALVRMVGFPDKWRSYDFAIAREDFAGNQLRAATAETKRVLARSGKPVDRAEWLMNTFAVDAYYNASANNTAILAGVLQPPFFGADRSVPANLGGIGMVIGHELTHAFDDQGAQFDAKGNLVNWWKPEDEQKFVAKGACVAKQYDTFEAAPNQFINGKLTLGENIADLGGVKMAFRAYRALQAAAPRAVIADGFTEDQQFFIGFGQAWCAKFRPAELQRRLIVDTHSPTKFRVYGALRNLPEFAQAFKCAPGTPMRPAETCSVW